MESLSVPKVSGTKKITVTAMFAAVATILMFFEFPLPFMPPFLKLDLSGAVTLIAAFMFGPAEAILITLIKDLVHLFSSNTGGVGQLADFIVLSCFALTAWLVYKRKNDKTHAVIGCVVATLVIAVVAVFTNKYLLIPFYSNIMPIEAIVGACKAVNPRIDSIEAYYIAGVLPFNLIKGALLSLVTILCYKKLSLIIKQTLK